MRRASFLDMNCSIARSLEMIGEWWTLLIVRDALLGVTRFEEFQERLGIARNILSKRLDTLVDSGIMERRLYDEPRERYDYVLTDMGKGLWTVMTTLRQWGDEWVVGPGEEPTTLHHKPCDHDVTALLVCDHCGEELQRHDLRSRLGPGATDDTILPKHRRAPTPSGAAET